MASTVSICNLALGHLGADKIDALSEASSEARACNRFYAQTLGALLSAGPPWRFARHEVTLAEVDGGASIGWAYAYTLPADLLRVRSIAAPASGHAIYGAAQQPDERNQPYELSSDRLYCNISPASLRYIRRIDDPSKFPPLFVEALSWHLAARLAMPLTRDAGQRQAAFQMALQTQAAAGAADANDEAQTSSFISEYERVRE